MSIKLNQSSFIVKAAMLLFTVLTTNGTWAQTPVNNESSLKGALSNGANLQLVADILLENYLNIDNMSVTIDLNGHKLYRRLSENKSDGHVIWVHNGSTLTLTSTATEKGKIEDGKANNGGAIHIPFGNTVIAEKVIFQNNSAADHAGAIWNNGTLTATDCDFVDNTASDVGAVYNSKTDSGCGTATLTNCTFTGNVGNTGAGALANALGETVMNINGCTIRNNTAGSYGGGIWNGGTLNVDGVVMVIDNNKASGVASNVFLKSGKLITVGDIEGSSIGVEMESTTGTFTSGWGDYDPSDVFTADLGSIVVLGLDANDEACISAIENSVLYFVERSWDTTNKQVVSTMNGVSEGQYTEVTAANGSWFVMSNTNSNVPKYYVARGNVNLETIVVEGRNVHLILCNNANLTLTGGLKLEGNNNLHIHCQSYSGDMGRLIVTNSYEYAAGIGSAHAADGGERHVGELFIYGGHIEATGGDYAAGIGSCAREKEHKGNLCSKVTVYGGYVKATGGKYGAGIGGGAGSDYYGISGGEFVMYDGTVIAQGKEHAAGVGGGGGKNESWFESDCIGGECGTVRIYGGTLTATGGEKGAGIGSGNNDYKASDDKSPGQVDIYGGTVTATGGKGAAGIGGGYGVFGSVVYIENGTVTATGGENGAGIGGGEKGDAGKLKILNGTVTATGGKGAAGLGGGYKGDGFRSFFQDFLIITGGTIIAKAGEQGGEQNRAIGPGKDNGYYGLMTLGNNMKVGAGNNGTVERYFPANERKKACWYRSYAEISPCTHIGCTYTVASDTHTRYCNYCSDTKTERHNFVNGRCTVCNYNTSNTYTVTVYLPDLENEENVYKSTTYQMIPGLVYMPGCDIIPDGYEFAGWLKDPSSFPWTYTAGDSEQLLKELDPYSITADVTFIARFNKIEVKLYNDQFNSGTIFAYDGMTAAVTLEGRTFYKDGNWNTLCLPFSLTEEQLENSWFDGGDIRTLSDASFSNGTLTLNFTEEGKVKSITAGTPYIVKWAEGDPINNPRFTNVKIEYTYLPVETNVVTFQGNYSPVGIGEEGDKTMLYLGVDNEGNSALFYPNAAMTIDSFRAYFQLNNGLVSGEPSSAAGINSFALNFGDWASSVIDIEHSPSTIHEGWYTIDGRKLNGKPTQKGIYIHNGKKYFRP